MFINEAKAFGALLPNPADLSKWNRGFASCALVMMVTLSFDFSINHFVLSTNFLFKFNVSLPLVTEELLQNTVDVNNVTYKLYNIKLQRLPVLLNTKNYLSTEQAIT